MMKQKFKCNEMPGRTSYVCAGIEVMEITGQSVICQSAGIDDMIVDPSDDGVLFETE